MANLSQIKTDSDWGLEASKINQNFNQVNTELTTLKNTTSVRQPLFSSTTEASKYITSPYVGQLVLIGSTIPAPIYRWNGSSWVDTGQTGGSAEVSLTNYYTKTDIDNQRAELESKIGGVGYITCETASGTAAKTITLTGLTALSTGIRLLVKMTNANTASNATLNINSLGAKPLYYNDKRVSTDNSWEAGEVIDVYFDGTNFNSSNVQGGSGSGGNLILKWNTDVATTRKQVKLSDRESLLQISYKDINGNPINEQYIGTTFTDTEWVKDSNWEKIASKSDISAILDDSRRYEYVGVKEFSGKRLNNNPTKEYFYYSKTGYNVKKIRVDADKYPCEYDLYIKDSQGEKYEHITQPDSNFVDVDIKITAGSQFTIRNRSTSMSYTFVTGGWAYDLQMYLASNNSLDNLWIDTLTKKNFKSYINLAELQFGSVNYGTKDMSSGIGVSANIVNKDTSYSPYSAPNSGYITKIIVAQPFSKEVNVQIYISDKGGRLTTGGSEIDMDKVSAKYTVKSIIGKSDIDCSFKIKQGQYIAIVYSDQGKYGSEGSYSGWGGLWYIYHQCTLVDSVTYLESQTGNNETPTPSGNTNKLKPCSVFSDTFAFDKQVDYVDTDASPYEIKTKPAWSLSEGVKINREDVLNSYIPLRNANNKCRLQHVYTADYRTETWLIELLDKSSVINIGSEIDYGSIEGQSSFAINFATKQIGSQSLEFEPEIGKYYCISLEHTSFAVSVTITDTSDITKKSIYSFEGELKGFPFLQLVSGSINVRKLDISILGNAATLYITGDSILMCKAVSNIKDRWGYKLRDDIGDVVISGRGTSAYKEVLYRLCSEIQFLKPRIVLDQNFVNGSDNKYIDFMIEWCKKNGIKYIHTMPFPSRYSKNGGGYIIQHCDTIRTDLATAIGGILDNGDDTSLLLSDKIHLNTAGSIAVYNRIKLEYPNW